MIIDVVQLHLRRFVMAILFIVVAMGCASLVSAEPQDEFDVDYAVYYLVEDCCSVQVRVVTHTFDSLGGALSIVEAVMGTEYDGVAEGASDVNATLGLALTSAHNPGNGWEPNALSYLRFFIVDEGDPMIPEAAILNRDGSQLKWKVFTDRDGYGQALLDMPDVRGTFLLVPQVYNSGGVTDYVTLGDKARPLDTSEVDRELELEYVIWSTFERWDGVDLMVHGHTFPDGRSALDFLNSTGVGQTDLISHHRPVSRGGAVMVSYASTIRVIDLYSTRGPNEFGDLRLKVIDIDDESDEPQPVRASNGTFLRWTERMDADGMGHLPIFMPEGSEEYRLYVEVAGGLGDSLYVVMENESCTLQTVAPPAYKIVETGVGPGPITIGSPMSAWGRLVLNYNGKVISVPEATIKVSGQHITSSTCWTDAEGRFYLSLTAPQVAMNNLTLDFTVDDAERGIQAEGGLTYSVIGEQEPPRESQVIPFEYIILLAIIGLATAVGLVVYVRRIEKA